MKMTLAEAVMPGTREAEPLRKHLVRSIEALNDAALAFQEAGHADVSDYLYRAVRDLNDWLKSFPPKHVNWKDYE